MSDHQPLSVILLDRAQFTLHWEASNILAEGQYTLDIPGAVWGDPQIDLHPGPKQTVMPPFPGATPLQIVRYPLALSGGDAIALTVSVSQRPDQPNALFFGASLENPGPDPIDLERLSVPALRLGAEFSGTLWSFMGAAVQWGQDFAFPLPESFHRDNFLGHIQNGEGGGIPLVCCWNRGAGLSLAHVEPQPIEWRLPVSSSPTEGVRLAFENQTALRLPAASVLRLPTVMVTAFHGDFFEPVARYREALAAQGILPAEPNDEDYAPAWCSWGYEFEVRPEEVIGVLPKLDELGIYWLTLDDRWFDRYGDWNPRSETFPGGENQMREMVDAIHRAGAYAQIWWYPLCVEDGTGAWDSHTYGVSTLLRDHPDWLILNPAGSPARNNRGLAMIDPSIPAVQDHLAQMTRRFILDWGFDGHKLDNIYTVPPCYNPAHHHRRPEESVEAFARAYQIIFDISRQAKPYSVNQICPCGTPPTFSLLPFMDQAVTADPTSSAQIRQRIKFYKALLGPRAAVFADHVELSDGGLDFASEIGAGGIPATKFTWPETPEIRARLVENWDLTIEKEAIFKQWLQIYAEYPIAKGETLNLYDLGFDVPETHAIRYGDVTFYSFFASGVDDWYDGAVEIRDLRPGERYQITDYVHKKTLGQVTGPVARIPVRFQGNLLVGVVPALG